MALRFLWPAKRLAAMPIYAKIRPKAILLVNNLAIYVNIVLKSQCKRRQLTAGSPVSELATSCSVDGYITARSRARGLYARVPSPKTMSISIPMPKSTSMS